jgi:DNA-binding GntR family transcriptional regulator
MTDALRPDEGRVVVALGTRGRRLVDRVYEGVLGAIRDGRIRPGDRLVLHHLAVQLGVSLSPVREAIARLSQDGLVRLEPHKGAVVIALTDAEIDQIYDVREALETYAIAQAIDRATSDDIDRLETACRRLESQGDEITLSEWFEANREFHRLLVMACGNQIVLEVLDGLWDRQSAITMLATYTTEHSAVEHLNSEHRAMLDAFRLGRVELAQALIKAHIRDGRHELHERMPQLDAPGQEVRADAK